MQLHFCQNCRRSKEKQAKAEGHLEANLENAQKMIAKDFDVKTISEITGLDVETIHELSME